MHPLSTTLAQFQLYQVNIQPLPLPPVNIDNVTYIDTDNANYNGVPVTSRPINVIKQVSGNNNTWLDADAPPGLMVTICSKVYYKFNVTNTGNVTLSNITLTDNIYNLKRR